MANKYSCGVDEHNCSGGKVVMNAALNTKIKKAHDSPEEAFRCRVHFLREAGWKQVGSREFKPPGGGPILVLTRKSKFGTRFRMGKNQDGQGHRFEPKSGGGFIQSC